QPHEELAHRRRRSATVFVKPVEHRERGQRGEDVFGLLQRAARTQRVGGGQPLGQGAARFVVFPVGGWKVSVQGGVGRPGAAGLLEVLAEGVAGVPGRRRRQTAVGGHGLGQARRGSQPDRDRQVLSQRKRQLIEQVITLGSPIADWTDLAALTHRAVGVVRTANELAYGRRLDAEGRFTYDLKLTPLVPTTSIYTKSDEVVNFR